LAGGVPTYATPTTGTVTSVGTAGTVNGLTLTGGPITGSGTINQLISHTKKLELNRGDSRLCVLPHSHAFGLVLDLLLGTYARQSLYLFSKGALSSRILLQAVLEREIRHLAVVPRMLELLLCFAREQGKEESLKGITIHTGGATISHALRVNARARVDALVLGYGLTECGPGVLIDGDPVGCAVKLSDVGLESTNVGFSELLVKTESKGVYTGVDNVTSDGFVRTGDLARLRDGRFEILGRSGELLKTTSGTWISNGELESLVSKRFGTPCALAQASNHALADVAPVSELAQSVPTTRIIFLGAETPRVNEELVSKFVESKIGYTLPCSFLGQTQDLSTVLDGSITKSTEDALRAVAKANEQPPTTASGVQHASSQN
jgi:acyl-CoA synthetase (AMP-forming)/AMP-acid ligase II